MIVEYIRYETEQGDGLIAAYQEARTSLDASPHCLGYELSRCTEDAKSFVLRIEWDSAEGHMQGFRSSPEFRAFLAAVKPFLGEIREMRHYERTAVQRLNMR